MKFFNIDAHISVIADITDIFKNLGHVVDSLSISGHTWVFDKTQDTPHIINSHNWKNIDEKMCEQFYKFYKDKLDKYDGFICTYPPAFAQLYEKFNKPTIVVSATRYEYPYTFDKNKWNNFNKFLNNKNIIKITNNLFDKYYSELFTEHEWTYIPSLCEYTKAKYNRKNDNLILFSKIKNINFLVNKETLGRYSWTDLYEFAGIVHIPYNYSTMSMFEQYTANVPILVPTKKFLTELFLLKQAMTEISYKQVFGMQPESTLNTFKDPNIYNNLSIFIENIEYADYYNKEWMPHIETFSSFEDLKYKIKHLNFDDISNKMLIKNYERKEKIYNMWEKIL